MGLSMTGEIFGKALNGHWAGHSIFLMGRPGMDISFLWKVNF